MLTDALNKKFEKMLLGGNNPFGTNDVYEKNLGKLQKIGGAATAGQNQ